MEANFAAKLSREEMARAAGLSVSYFSKLFTHCIGLSPHQYLVRCRLRHGKKLLVTPEENLSIVDVAAEAGFADQAHFSRHFRRAYGVSPLAFRRNARRRNLNLKTAAPSLLRTRHSFTNEWHVEPSRANSLLFLTFLPASTHKAIPPFTRKRLPNYMDQQIRCRIHPDLFAPRPGIIRKRERINK